MPDVAATQSEFPILELIKKRWSPVIFEDRAVEPEKLRTLLEAARWAASCYNEQPWSFIVARKEDPEEFQRLLSCLVPANVVWAQHAPVLMLSVAGKNFTHNQSPNRHAFHDTGAATAFLMLQATALGLHTHAMAGFDAQKAREVYAIPETHDAVAAIAAGYLGDDTNAPEDLKKRNTRKPRKALESFVFGGKFGQTSPLVGGSK